MHAHGRPPRYDDAKGYADFLFVGQYRASGKRPVVRLAREPVEFLLRKHREQRDLGEDLLGRCHGPMLRP